MDRVEIKIAGHAGEGIKVSGLTLNRALSALGYHTFGYSEYPSLIRGGHNSYQLSVGVNPVYSPLEKTQILIALNQNALKKELKNLKDSSIVILNSNEANNKSKHQTFSLDLSQMAKDAGGPKLMANTVALGAVLKLMGLPLDSLNQVLRKAFSHKSDDIVTLNQKAANLGYNAVDTVSQLNPAKKSQPKPVLTGNEATALGAIAGGLKFFSAYPMTPATSILHYLAAKANHKNILVKHVGDEISAINMALGAAFTGVRAMTATSGGGLCLMAEGVSLSGVAELPLVIVNAQRPGPGLGIPTWTAQGDLRFCLHIGHDEFPRIILAPGDAQEAFDLTRQAFDLAEKYQLPVIILSDKHLAESDFCCPELKSHHQVERFGFVDQAKPNYLRYRLTDNGISKRTVPGQENGEHVANSYEHDQTGYATEDSQPRTEQMDKRFKKLETLKSKLPQQTVYQAKGKKIGLISWGTNKGATLEAIKQNPQASYLHLSWIWPLPVKQIEKFAQSVEKLVVVESNSQAQLAGLIQEHTNLKFDQKILKYDGRPFWPKEIVNQI